MKKNVDMLKGPLASGILAYTIPIILTSILQLLFNAADLMIVGHYCGSIHVAAVSATGSLTALVINFFIGLSVGAGVTVAHGIGSRQDSDVHRTIHTAIPTALISGGILTVIGVIFAGDFLSLMGTPENILPLSTIYMRIYFSGMIFNMLYNFVASILRAAGDTKSPLIFLTIAGIINVILNIIFVLVFKMNVDGVALATTISQAVSAILVTIVLMRRTDCCRFIPKKMRVYTKQMLKILRVGMPAGIQSSLFAISNVMIQSSINSFNSEAIVSGNGAAANVEGFVYVIMNSFHQTALNYTGQNAGAHQFDRIKKVLVTCLGYVLLFGAVAGTVVWALGENVLSFYITDSADAIKYGIIRFSYVARFYFLCGLMDVTTGALRGLGSSLTPMVITILGACGLRLAWIFTIFQIPQYHTLDCLFISYPISWVITFLVEVIAFVILFNKKANADRLLTENY